MAGGLVYEPENKCQKGRSSVDEGNYRFNRLETSKNERINKRNVFGEVQGP